MAAYREVKNLPRTVTLIAVTAAVLVALLLPAVYYAEGRARLLHEISTKASVKADLVSHLATRSPESWRYQDTRLIELLESMPAAIGDDRATIVTRDGRVVVQVGEALTEPSAAASRPVLDAGMLVGEVHVSRSLRPLLANTLAFGLLGVALGGVVFLALRVLPLRALRAATNSLDEHLRYQQKIAAFGQFALGKNTAEQLIEEAAQRVLQGLGPDVVAYVEQAAADHEIVLRAVEGLQHPATARTAGYGDDTPVARALQGPATVHVARSDRAPAPLPFDWARHVSDALLVPMTGGGGVRAALCALGRPGQTFGAQQAKFVESMANVLSTGLQRMETETRLAFLAQFDGLTGLPNRTLLRDRCSQHIVRARRRGAGLAVLFVDLDGFKAVNDSLGHGAGDDLLRQTAARLQACVRSDDTVARNSGDEFAIVLADLARPEDAAIVAQKVVEQIASPFEICGREVFVTASVGIAGFPNDGADAEALITAADGAMYRAKQLGRNGYQFFTAEINQRLRVRSQLVTELHRALERNEFLLHYQPKVSLSTGTIEGVEALLRWAHPERGLVSPAAFIPALEETGLIIPVGQWVTNEACRQVRAWQQGGLKARPV
ncbi:MAG: putative bifunctional diguanylate cyclase/phosphodiesterase, partial [Betaproteobacteria bacterium]